MSQPTLTFCQTCGHNINTAATSVGILRLEGKLIVNPWQAAVAQCAECKHVTHHQRAA